jgi:protein-S-isoprenylcysteine O-methyltransferase Ste14
MFLLARALSYATLFVGFLLLFLPGRLLSWSGVVAPTRFGLIQIAGLLVAAAGAVVALSSILTFAFVGKGTPAPFDPPRRLVVTGPYRFLRNPMYLGAGTALAGAALYYRSLPLLAYALGFLLLMHLFAVGYEEPVLRASFGAPYEEYCRNVPRWLRRNPRGPASPPG